jgi:hypothetical protein
VFSEGKGHTFESCRVRQRPRGICGFEAETGLTTAEVLIPSQIDGLQPYFSRSRSGSRLPTESDAHMSERLETLKKARERMTEDRDAFAKTLAAPFDRDKAERARLKFVETQVLIDAIDRAIMGEQAAPAAAP